MTKRLLTILAFVIFVMYIVEPNALNALNNSPIGKLLLLTIILIFTSQHLLAGIFIMLLIFASNHKAQIESMKTDIPLYILEDQNIRASVNTEVARVDIEEKIRKNGNVPTFELPTIPLPKRSNNEKKNVIFL